jgi:hypothetical protein
LKNRRLIHRTSLSGGRPLAFEGADVISWRASILEGLAGVPGLADFLADPVKVPSDNWINWYTPLDGEPKPLSSLPPAQRAAASRKAGETLDEFKRAAERLKGSDRYKMRQAGEIMLAAVSSPQALAFFSLEGAIVCAGWGMAKSAPVLFEPEVEPEPEPEPYVPPPPEPEPYVPPPPPPPPPKPRRDWKCFFRRVAFGTGLGLVITLVCILVFSRDVRWALSALFLPPWGEGVETRESVISGLRGERDAALTGYFGRRDVCLVVPQGPAPEGGAGSYLSGCYTSRPGVFYDASTSAPQALSVCVTGQGAAAEILLTPSAGGGEPCRVPASASAEEGRVIVTSDSEATCGKSVYPPLRVTCEAGDPDGVQAGCSMEEDNGENGYYDAVPVDLRKSWK